MERTCGVVGEAECCGLKVRAPQSCGAAMPSVVMKAACSSGGSGSPPTRLQQSVGIAATKNASDTYSNMAIQRTLRLSPTAMYSHKRRMTRPPKNESCLCLLRRYTASRSATPCVSRENCPKVSGRCACLHPYRGRGVLSWTFLYPRDGDARGSGDAHCSASRVLASIPRGTSQ